MEEEKKQLLHILKDFEKKGYKSSEHVDTNTDINELKYQVEKNKKKIRKEEAYNMLCDFKKQGYNIDPDITINSKLVDILYETNRIQLKIINKNINECVPLFMSTILNIEDEEINKLATQLAKFIINYKLKLE